jgi:hypothetical protein
MRMIWLALVFITTSSGVPRLAAYSDQPRTVTEVFDRTISGEERQILAVAEAMPADKYAFAPVNGEFSGVRTFGQMVKHIAVDYYVDAAALLQEKIPIDPGDHENGPDSIRGKSEVLKLLRDSFIYMHKAIRTVNQKNLMEPVQFQDVRIPRLSIVTSALAHPMDHYGQLIEYLRMNGIDPQKMN